MHRCQQLAEHLAGLFPAPHIEGMELTYPINLIGIEGDAQSGDVLCRYGEVLGRWELDVTEEPDGIAMGELHFTPHGETERLFSEGIPSMESGLRFGMAMSFLCASIREWHEGK